jgi:transcriptional regulator with XRE-family HTH domain
MIKPFAKLRSEFVLKGIMQKDLAEKLDLANSTLSQKLNGDVQFSMVEIYTICDVLNISEKDIYVYFPKTEVLRYVNKRRKETAKA